MSNRYPGGFITLEEPDVSPAGATGVWTLSQQEGYEANGEWPSATYEISRSLRFNSADSTYLTRTPASASNRKTWTWSGWVKRSGLADAYQAIFEVFNGNNDNQTLNISFQGSSFGGVRDAIAIGAYSLNWLVTTAVYRDPSAWYHIVLAVDTTQATANNRIRLYVNGSEVTAFGTRNNPTQNADLAINQSAAHYIGSGNARNFFNGYLTDINFIDGQQLTPSSFGKTNAVTGVWEPIIYAGSYGTNGFYLPFSDNSSTTALGYDESGNGNNWTPNNFSVTAGAGNDSLVDTPTPYGTDTGAGGEVRGNYATLNPLDTSTGSTFSQGNLQVVTGSTEYGLVRATIGVSSGKWYWEVVQLASGTTNNTIAGIAKSAASLSSYLGGDANGWGYLAGGNKITNNSSTSYGASWTTNDVIGVAFDADNGTLEFYKNGVSQGTAFTGLTSGPYFPALSDAASAYTTTASVNFGQRPFAYTAPSGFKALCTQNLPEPTVVQGDDYFNTVLWTGASTSSSRSITGVGFQPDFVWVKSRNQGLRHNLYDAVRGVGKELISSSTSAEVTNDINGYISAFDSDGFSTTPGSTDNERFNASGYTYVAWNWNAGGSTATNTDGTISAQVRANPTAGVSIATYTGTGVAGSIGHGLGATPKLYIIKSRSSEDWYVFTTVIDGSLDFLILDTTDAKSDSAATSPTSTVVNVLTAVGQNQNGINYVMYAFAAVPGFSAMGSYTGNGSTDGPFIYTGFRPAFVLIKQSSAAGNNWTIVDDKRDDYNVADLRLFPNASDAESSSYVVADLLSNGFKVRGALGSTNTSSATYIYMAFAENPFKYSLAR